MKFVIIKKSYFKLEIKNLYKMYKTKNNRYIIT